MPFRKYLEDHSFCPETVKVMSQALTLVCRELDAAGIPQYSTSALVQMIVAVASSGETDSERLAHTVLQSIQNSRKQNQAPTAQPVKNWKAGPALNVLDEVKERFVKLA